jgi:hypothetical protein
MSVPTYWRIENVLQSSIFCPGTKLLLHWLVQTSNLNFEQKRWTNILNANT